MNRPSGRPRPRTEKLGFFDLQELSAPRAAEATAPRRGFQSDEYAHFRSAQHRVRRPELRGNLNAGERSAANAGCASSGLLMPPRAPFLDPHDDVQGPDCARFRYEAHRHVHLWSDLTFDLRVFIDEKRLSHRIAAEALPVDRYLSRGTGCHCTRKKVARRRPRGTLSAFHRQRTR